MKAVSDNDLKRVVRYLSLYGKTQHDGSMKEINNRRLARCLVTKLLKKLDNENNR